MPKIAVIVPAALASNPDTMSGGRDPRRGDVPIVLQLPGCNGIDVTVHATGVGVATVRPYYHVNGDDQVGRWAPLGFDAAAGVGASPVTADPAQDGGMANGRYAGLGEPRLWVLVQESGGGTVDDASLDAVDRFGR